MLLMDSPQWFYVLLGAGLIAVLGGVVVMVGLAVPDRVATLD